GGRLLDPLRCALGGVFGDHWADVGGFVERIADFEPFDAVKKALEEARLDTALNENALPGNAALAGVREAALDAAVGGVINVRIRVDNDAGVAAEFERDFFLAGFRFQRPTDGAAAGEGEELEAIVGDELFGVGIRKRQDVERPGGSAGFFDDFGEK